MMIKKLKRILFYIRKLSIIEFIQLILSKFYIIKLPGYEKYLDHFRDKCGIEIGGPSDCFRTDNILPLYPVIKGLDGVNFSETTLWSDADKEYDEYKYDHRVGRQYISDAVSLDTINSHDYDFVIACNSLEHIANPILALKEWLRIINDQGLILLVLPNKLLNFDHKRDITTIEHLIEDYTNRTSEDDLYHLDEILKNHDLELDPQAGSIEEFRERSMDNYNNRALHHHVFDMELLREIFRYLGIQIIMENMTITDLYILGRKGRYNC